MNNQTNQWPWPTQTPESANQAAKTGQAIEALNIVSAKFLEDQERAAILVDAKIAGVGLVHIYNPYYAYGGLSVAFKKSSEFESGTMVNVAVATCSHKDAFSKKIGAKAALTKFFDGETIQLPLMKHVSERDLPYIVKEAFSALYAKI